MGKRSHKPNRLFDNQNNNLKPRNNLIVFLIKFYILIRAVFINSHGYTTFVAYIWPVIFNSLK